MVEDIIYIAFAIVMVSAILGSYWLLATVFTQGVKADVHSALVIYRVGNEVKVLWIDKERGVSGIVITPTGTKIYKVTTK